MFRFRRIWAYSGDYLDMHEELRRPVDGIGTTLPGRTGLAGLFPDESVFRAWYDDAFPRVYAYLFRRCGRNQLVAEDLTQQAFVDACRSRPPHGPKDPLGWVIGIARHRLVDHFRASERQERSLRRLIARGNQANVTWIGVRDEQDELVEALRRLPAAQRAALTLRYVDDLPVREVAALLAKSEKAVESLLSRGREGLRRSLGVRE